MAVDRIDAITALLVQTAEAHHVFETTELKGVYDQDWALWYAAHAVDHGLGALVGRAVTADELAPFLAKTNGEFEQIEPRPDGSWAAYTARRITADL